MTAPAGTTTRTVTVKLDAADNLGVAEMRFANEDGVWSAWQRLASSAQWTLSAPKYTPQTKGFSAQVRDAAHNGSNTIYTKLTCNAPCN